VVQRGSEEGRYAADEIEIVPSGAVEVSPGRRAARSFAPVANAFGRRWPLQPERVAVGSRLPGRGGEGFRGDETPGEQRPAARGNSRRRARTREGKKASRRVKPAETSISHVGTQVARDGVASAALRKGGSVGRGTRQARVSAGVGETRGETVLAGAAGTQVNDREGASGLERGARSSRGERSEGAERKSRTAAARNKAAKLERASKPLRG
jgi:hypothetical protein